MIDDETDAKVDEQLEAARRLLDEAELGLHYAVGDLGRELRVKIAGARIALGTAHAAIGGLRLQREVLRRSEGDW